MSTATGSTTERIRALLAPLSPLHLVLADESARHVGHAGAAAGGGHFQLTIVSEAFTGQNALARHRSVFSLLAPLMQREIHALSMNAMTPAEAEKAGLAFSQSAAQP